MNERDSLQRELLRLLDQVLDMLETVCRTEEPVNHILQDYRDTKHLAQMVQQLVGVASNEFIQYLPVRPRLRKENDRLKQTVDRQLRDFKLERAEHIRLEIELKTFIENLQNQLSATKSHYASYGTSKEERRSHHKPTKSTLCPPIPTTTSTVPSAVLSRHGQPTHFT